MLERVHMHVHHNVHAHVIAVLNFKLPLLICTYFSDLRSIFHLIMFLLLEYSSIHGSVVPVYMVVYRILSIHVVFILLIEILEILAFSIYCSVIPHSNLTSSLMLIHVIDKTTQQCNEL